MKKIWIEYLESANILRNNYIRFTKYQLATKILISIILLPTLYWTMNLLIQNKGYDYLTNGLIKKFLFSYQGLLVLFLTLIFGLVIILIEFGGLIFISYQSIYEKKETSYINVLKYSVSKIKYLMGIDGFLVVFYLLLMVPLLNQFFDVSIFNSIEIPRFIMDDINSKLINRVYLSIIWVIFIILSIRWIFVMHIITLENKVIKYPLKESASLVKKNFRRLIKFITTMVIFNIAISFMTVLTMFLLASIIMALTPSAYEAMVSIVVASIMSIIFFILSFIVPPLNIIILTKFYLEINSKVINIDLVNKKKVSIIDQLFASKKLLFSIFVIAITVVSFISYSTIDHAKNNIEITAHRGSVYEAPENTIAAIEQAIKNGADFVEFDVRETKDHQVIVLHDDTFKRTTGVNKKSYELTLKEVKQLDAGSFFSQDYKGEEIPTLEEVMDYAKGKIKLNIEIKPDAHSKHLVREVTRIIEEKKMDYSCVVTSLDYDALLEVKRLNPRIKIGYIILIVIGDLSKLEVDFYSIEETYVTETMVADAHKLGREVHIWTINSEEGMDYAIELGVDNIITDNIKELRSKIKLDRYLIK